jgi:hypothetical protein
MNWRRIVHACAALAALCTPAFAQTPHRTGDLILVELYTSQGCDTCRRANRLIGVLAAEPDILALTFSVDYWDYLGWRDTFALSEFTARQRRYWRSLRSRSLYTPEVVVNGAAHVNGAHEDRVRELLGAFRAAPLQRGPRITIERDGTDIRVQIARAPHQGEAADVWGVGFDPGPIWEMVRTGENAGHRVAHYNLVRNLRRLGEWSGEPMQFRYGYCRRQCAVIVQRKLGGPVLAVARTPPPAPPTR